MVKHLLRGHFWYFSWNHWTLSDTLQWSPRLSWPFGSLSCSLSSGLALTLQITTKDKPILHQCLRTLITLCHNFNVAMVSLVFLINSLKAKYEFKLLFCFTGRHLMARLWNNVLQCLFPINSGMSFWIYIRPSVLTPIKSRNITIVVAQTYIVIVTLAKVG